MEKVRYAYFLLFVFFLTNNAFCQFPLFKDNDRVCFIGNSITMNGKFHNYIELYYATRFPDRKVKFFNCGISGDVSGGILRRMERDILVNKPTWSVLMVGMNDIRTSLYTKERQNEPGIIQKQQDALDRYFTNVDSIVRLLIKANSKIVLQTPSIFDQTGDLAAKNAVGANDALKKCAIYLKELAAKYKLPVVDYWTVMTEVNGRVQKSNPKATIISSDRVHPGVEGHFLMAGEFLKTQHAPEYVSYASIDGNKNKVIRAVQCSVSNLRHSTSGISFTSRETSLPVPLLSENFKPDSLFSFTNELNKEILQIKSLKKGDYVLRIDSVVAGTYSEKDFNTGINLSKNELTPQYHHAKKVLEHLAKYWDLKRRLRQIVYVEFQILGGDMKQDFNEADARKLFAQKMGRRKGESQDNLDYYKENFESYLISKPIENELQKKEVDSFYEIQLINKPVNHNYKVTVIK